MTAGLSALTERRYSLNLSEFRIRLQRLWFYPGERAPGHAEREGTRQYANHPKNCALNVSVHISEYAGEMPLQVHPTIGRKENDFADGVPKALGGRDFDGTVRGRRCIGQNPIILEHFLQPQEVKTIAYHNRAIPPFGLHQAG